MSHRITFYGSLETRLRAWLDGSPEKHERGALVLFRRYRTDVEGLPESTRFVAIDVVELDGDWILESSSTRLRINLRNLPSIYLRCETDGLQLGFAHSHPDGALFFSSIDDQNEQNILRGYAGCNGLDVDLISLVLSSGKWIARVRRGNIPEVAEPVRHVSAIGDLVDLHLADAPSEDSEILARQEAAFGKPFNRKLQSLRVAVVGVGGTGSPLVTLLARSGVGELILIDGDRLEETNLNRVRGYRKDDVGEPKAEILAKYVEGLGLPNAVASISSFIGQSPEAIDAIATADFVFGCTDDVTGRDILTQAAYYYCLPYIDVGLTGAIREDNDGTPYLYDHRARVSTLLPERGACLRCQGVVTEAKLAFERALKERPELAGLDPETLRREYYLTGGNESAPGVGAFTSAAADLAMATFMDLVRPYRRLSTDFRRDNVWYDFVHLALYSNMPSIDPDCFCCGVNGLLCAPERGYRLGMPALGRTQL
jgi:molybdopterin/thiamine biosynthesis adenylyltransferase